MHDKPLPTDRPHRRKLATWDDCYREQWGILTNKLIDQGMELWAAEILAFETIQTKAIPVPTATPKQQKLSMQTEANHSSPYDPRKEFPT